MTSFLKSLEWQMAGSTIPCWIIDFLRNQCLNRVLGNRLKAAHYLDTLNLFYDL